VRHDDLSSTVLRRIAAKLGLSEAVTSTLRLIKAGKQLEASAACGLAKGDTVHVVGGLDGGAPTQRCGGTEDAAFNAWLDAGAPTCNDELVQMGLSLRCFTPRDMLGIVLDTEPDSAIVNFIDGSRKNEPAHHAPPPHKTESSAGQHTCGAPPHCSKVDEIISGIHQAWFERGGQSKFAFLELFNACVDGRLEGEHGVKQLLVVQEPDIFVTIEDGPGDEFETTALSGAIVAGQLEAMRLLLAHGADPNLADSDGMTPLMVAACYGRVLAVKELVARGAYLNTRHPRGSTAFHEACIHNKPKCAALLVKLGCDRTLQTNDGRTGEQLAQARGHRRVCAAVALASKAEVTKSSAPPFQIFYRDLAGKHGTLDGVCGDDSASAVLTRIAAKLGLRPAVARGQLRLLKAGKQLELTAASCGLAKGDTVHVVGGLDGGIRIREVESASGAALTDAPCATSSRPSLPTGSRMARSKASASSCK
jgi:hypothetical protein